jgi:hypothetical protein
MTISASDDRFGLERLLRYCASSVFASNRLARIDDQRLLYELADPAVLVRVSGMAPLDAKVYECQRLRCNLCGEVSTAVGVMTKGPAERGLFRPLPSNPLIFLAPPPRPCHRTGSAPAKRVDRPPGVG